MATLNFNAANVAPQQSFEPLPAGWYPVVIEASEIKPTSAGTGNLLEMTFRVLEGQFANRKVFGRLNIDNPNPVAVEIAYAQLSAIAHAVGVIQVQDSQQLHEKPLAIKVSVTQGRVKKGFEHLPPAQQEFYDPSNDIKAYKPINEMPTGAMETTQASPSFAPAASTPAWANQPAAQPTAQKTYQALVQQTYQPPENPQEGAPQYAPPVDNAPQQQATSGTAAVSTNAKDPQMTAAQPQTNTETSPAWANNTAPATENSAPPWAK